MDVEQRKEGDIAVVALSGEIDADGLPTVSEAIARTIDAGHERIVLNVGKVAIVTSSAIGYMLKVARHLKAQGGALAISEPAPWFRRNLDTLGISRMLDLFPDDEAALRHLTRASASDAPPAD